MDDWDSESPSYSSGPFGSNRGRGGFGASGFGMPKRKKTSKKQAEVDELSDDENLDIDMGEEVREDYLKEEEKKENPGRREFDFRFKQIPEGISVQNGETNLIEQEDGCSFLELPAGAHLRVDLNEIQASGGSRVNQWTITFDVEMKSLPPADMSLVQTCYPEFQASRDVSILKESGSLGIFQGFGEEPDHFFKPGRWNRVTITNTLKDDLNGQFNEVKTYVNGNLSSTAKAGFRQDQRFSLDPKGILLFAQSNPEIFGGLRIKRLEVNNRCFSEDEIKSGRFANSVYSQWLKEQKNKDAMERAQLSLTKLYNRPPRVWRDPSFLGQFADAYIAGTNIGAGGIYGCLKVFDMALKGMWTDQSDWLLKCLGEELMNKCSAELGETISEAVSLSRKFEKAKRGAPSLIAFIRHLRKSLESLGVGKRMLVPGGINSGRKIQNMVYIVEKMDEKTWRFLVVNTGYGNNYHPKQAQEHPKIKYKNCIVFNKIPEERVLDDAWWLFILRLMAMPNPQYNEETLYDFLLPYLSEKPLEDALVDSLEEFDWRTPQRSLCSAYRSLMESYYYMLQKAGLTKDQRKQVFFNLRRQYMKMVIHDLHAVQDLSESDVRLVTLATQQLSYHAVKLGDKDLLSLEQLNEVRNTVDVIQKRVNNAQPRSASDFARDVQYEEAPLVLNLLDGGPPPELDLDSGKSMVYEWMNLPMYKRLLREEDVNGYAGDPIEMPRFVPIDFLLVPKRADNFEDCLTALRWCDKLCTKCETQQALVKHWIFLKVAICEHVFTKVVPIPKPFSSPDRSKCPWATDVRYALQLDILVLLQRISEHFTSAAYSVRPTRQFFALRITVMGAIAAIADVVMRKRATDIPSELCIKMLGDGTGIGYGLGAGRFGKMSETIPVIRPELNVARTSIIDYFDNSGVDDGQRLFCWEDKEMMMPETSMLQLLGEVCMTFPYPPDKIPAYLIGDYIPKNYPEWICYRDVCFLFKLTMGTDAQGLPRLGTYVQAHSSLKWSFRQGVYIVQGLGVRKLSCYSRGHLFPSQAIPSFYCDDKIQTEDDVLFVENSRLPNFDNLVTQRDSELLLSYMTVPYLRLPLIMSFFSTEDRIHCLKSDKLKDLLSAVLFEPSRYLPCGMNIAPTMVPTEDPTLLCTPYGLLFNELQRSPMGVIDSMMELLKLALDLDIGTFKAPNSDIVRYVVRTACRFENYMTFLIQHATDTHPHIPSSRLRDVEVTDDCLQTLKDGRERLRMMLRGHCHNMFESWIDQALAEVEGLTKEDAQKMDKNVKIACNLYAHLVLVYRNTIKDEMDFRAVITLLSSFTFLSSRHTWNQGLLEVPETELFETMQFLRRNLINWMDSCPRQEFNEGLQAIVRVTSGAGRRVKGPDDVVEGWGKLTTEYAILDSPNQRGRYVVVESHHRRAILDFQNSERAVPFTTGDQDYGCEINLNSLQLTMKSNHLEALPSHIAGTADMGEIFAAKESMQCALVSKTKHRVWYKLVGRHHSVQYWDQDERPLDMVTFDRQYDPGFLGPNEKWVGALFEPVRVSFFVKPVEFPFMLPEEELTADDRICVLQCVHPKLQQLFKEVIVYKDYKMVEVYDVLSHGRRFYRSLVFTTNTRFSLRFLQESTEGRRSTPPAWILHGAGNPKAGNSDPETSVITREAHLPNNYAGTEEMFVPARLLFGILPSALLETHLFWQDDNDNIRGYPKDKREMHIILIEFKKQKIDGWNLEDAVARVSKRFLVKDDYKVEPTAENIFESVTAEEETGLYNENGARTRPEKSSRELDLGVYKDEDELVLLNLLHAPRGSPLHSLVQVLTRLETASHILAWSKKKTSDPSELCTIDLVELPRQELTFSAKIDSDGVTRLYSVDHSDLFISNQRRPLICKLIRGIPHSLILSNANNETQILVPSLHPYRPPIGTDPFSTWLVMDRSDLIWQSLSDPPYFLYPVHVSLSFMFTKTLGSALYLLLLRFLNRDYDSVYRLSTSISTDTDFNTEQEMIFQALKHCGDDQHPNAHAVRARISLMTQDSPSFPPWDLPSELSKLVVKWPHISSTCRMDRAEELQVFQEAESQLKKMEVIKNLLLSKSKAEIEKLAEDLLNPDPGQTFQERKKAEQFLDQCREKIEAKMDVTVEDRLIKMFFKKVLQNAFLDEYHDCLLFNRVRYLESHVDGLKASQIKVPKKRKTSDWHLHYDRGAFHCMGTPWQMRTMRFKVPMALNGHMVCGSIDALLNRKEEERETLLGGQIGYGFLFLYMLYTKSIPTRIGANDDSWSLARLCTKYYIDTFRETHCTYDELGNFVQAEFPNQTIFASILSIISQNPQIIDKLPKFVDNRPSKSQMLQGFIDDQNPVSPLNNLMTELVPILMSFQESVNPKFDYTSLRKLPEPKMLCKVTKYADPNILEKVEDLEGVERSAVSPQLSNFLCDRRELKGFDLEILRLPLDADEKKRTEIALHISEETLDEFGGSPLKQLLGFVESEPPSDLVDPTLPFDISGHSYAETDVAKSLIKRLHEDLGIHAKRVNDGKRKIIKGLNNKQLEAFVSSGFSEQSANIDSCMKMLDELRTIALSLKENDDTFVDAAIPVIVQTANYVDLKDASFDRMKYLLNRHAGRESSMWINYLIGSLISDRAAFDLLKLNPYLDPAVVDDLECLVMMTLLHANRHGQTNEVLGAIRNLEKMLSIAKKPLNERRTPPDALLAGLKSRVEELARLISKGRYYVEKDRSFDPRYLLFEFTWNITLRDRQVEIVREFYSSIKKGESLVKQMIMGAGKTTVVSPLINLMVADGKTLMVQVVPPQLLEFSRGRLRETFSSIMQKRIYTFNFDRSSTLGPATFQKFQNAIKNAGVIVTTPTAIKSLMLKYLECCTYVTDENSRRPKDLNKLTQNIAKALRVFNNGVLMMDEVDLILHPLKSELNFPIGAKHPLDFNPLRWKLPIHMLDAFFYASRGKMSVGFEGGQRAIDILEKIKGAIEAGTKVKALQLIPHIILLNEEFYHLELKPLLAEWALLWLEICHFKGVDEDDRREYILKGPFRCGQAAERIENQCTVDHKKMLNLVHDWLRSFVPHVTAKVDRVTYGIMTEEDHKRARAIDPMMPATRFKMAIPFVGKDVPSRSSEFAHPDVIIGLSVLAYRYEGLRYSDFVDIIAELRSEAIKETIPWNERKAVKRYNKWVDEAGAKIRDVHKYVSLEDQMDEDCKMSDDEITYVIPLKLLKRSNEDQMQELFDVFRQVPDVIHYYLEKMIFPAYMRHQIVKLSASGQELGGPILFQRRIGFSGTPSDLLPIELGTCGYEPGSDGKMLTYLTDPKICSYEVLPERWSVNSVLDRIAQSTDPKFNALIDTGALITGMTNFEVAKYLLDHGLSWAEGVVFLDADDKQQILVRATGRVVQLNQCGIEKKNRFAFYDQIHTTGMDIKHVYNAKAVVTLGKDMVFRDYAQGAFRMRGIGKGHTIHLFIIPEIEILIARELTHAHEGRCQQVTEEHIAKAVEAEMERARSEGLPIDAYFAEKKAQLGAEMDKLDAEYRLRGLNVAMLRQLSSERFERTEFDKDCDRINGEVKSAILDGHPNAKELSLFEEGLAKVRDNAHVGAAAMFPPEFMQWSELSPENVRQVLVDVSAWLNISSMRSERLQWNMLCQQNYCNVYRKQAWKHLSQNSSVWRIHEEGRNMVLDIRDPENYKELINRPGLAVVKYSSKKNRHCLWMDPHFDEVAKTHTKATFVNVDIDVCGTIAKEENLSFDELPAFKFYVNGECMEDEGFSGTNLDELKSKVANFQELFATNLETTIPKPDNHSLLALKVFQEGIDFSLEGAVPKPRKFTEVLREKVAGMEDFVVTNEDRETIQTIESIVGDGTHDDAEAAYLKEIVAEAEKEEEQEKEKDQEREIELEVFVAKDWNREDEEPTPWPFASLGDVKNHGSMIDNFYRARKFKLWNRESVEFPPYMYISENYFDPKWSGERRIKNVVMVLELEVRTDDILAPPPMMRQLTSGTNAAMERSFHFLGLGETNLVDYPEALALTIRAAMDFKPSDDEIVQVLEQFATEGTFGVKEFQMLLESDIFRKTHDNRFYVALSLAEAETIRRIMHLKSDLLPGCDTQMALRCKTADYKMFDVSKGYSKGSHYQNSVTHHCFQYLDCDTYFKDREIGILIRSMQETQMIKRRVFFQQIISCKRRLQKTWEKTPISKFFRIKTEFHYLKVRALTFRVREQIKDLGLLHWDAFRMFNTFRTGLLSGPELWGALEWMNIKVTALDLLELLEAFDIDKDQNLSPSEFFQMIRDLDATLDEELKEQESHFDVQSPQNYDDVKIEPKYEDGDNSLEALRAQMEDHFAKMEVEYEGAVTSTETAVQRVGDAEKAQRRKDFGLPPNPNWDGKMLIFDYQDSELPIGGRMRGSKEFMKADNLKDQYLKVNSESFVVQAIRHEEDATQAILFANADDVGLLNRYTLYFDVNFDNPPQQGETNMGLFTTLRLNEDGTFASKGGAGIILDEAGQMGVEGHMGAFSQVPRLTWSLLTISVDCIAGQLTCYCNENKVWEIANHPSLTPGGPFAIDPKAGIGIFGASETKHMCGGSVKNVWWSAEPDLYEAIIQKANDWRESNKWTCPQCTVRNSTNSLTCSVCGYQRKAAVSKNENPVVAQICSMGYAPDVVRFAMNKVGDDPSKIMAFILGEQTFDDDDGPPRRGFNGFGGPSNFPSSSNFD